MTSGVEGALRAGGEHPAGAERRPGGHDLPVTIIRPSKGWVSLDLAGLWAYRELFVFLVWRDVKVRYKQTAIGIVWVILQPFLTMLTFSLIFGRLAGLQSDGFPYPIFLYSALLPWQLFSNALIQSSSSIVLNQQLVTKVYFPRLIIPLASVLSGLVDFFFAFLVLVGMMVFYGIAPTWAILLLPAFILLAVATALAVGLWLSALNARYRDVQYAIPFITQFWFFITPIIYSASLLPGRFTIIYGLNPMVGVVQGFRWALLGTAPNAGLLLGIGVAMTLALLGGGLLYFRRTERVFADIV